MEEVGIGWSRHERSNGDARILQLITQPLGEGVYKRLGCRRRPPRMVPA
jgi:hypothetical protein